jgi:hypothetical protein
MNRSTCSWPVLWMISLRGVSELVAALEKERSELAALRGAARCHINQWPMQPDEAAAWNRALDPC